MANQRRDVSKNARSMDVLTVKNSDGTERQIKMRRCSDGSGTGPDFSGIRSCPRCEGHTDAEGRAHGGFLKTAQCVGVSARTDKPQWYRGMAACPACAFGAFRVYAFQRQRLAFYDQLAYAPKGLNAQEIWDLHSHLTGADTLVDAAERIDAARLYRQKVIDACIDVETAEMNWNAAEQEPQGKQEAEDEFSDELLF